MDEPVVGTAGQSGGVNMPAPSATPSTPAEPVGVAGLSRDQTQMADMILSDYGNKLMDRETADRSLQESIGKRLADFENDKRTPNERQFDKEFPVALPHQIQWPHTEETTTPAYNAVRNEVNSRFIDAGMTADTASFIIKEAEAFGYRSEKWTPEEHTLYARTEMAKLTCLLGDATQQKITMAQQFIQKLETKRPGLVALLETTGLGSNSGVILQVIHHLDRLNARSKPA
jgi:hypothetical protein